jgi:hypothetical protein
MYNKINKTKRRNSKNTKLIKYFFPNINLSINTKKLNLTLLINKKTIISLQKHSLKAEKNILNVELIYSHSFLF